MKHLKKLLVVVAALVMAMALAVPAFAADKTITVNGLEAGDNVKYYKVIEWAADGSGWKFVAPFDEALTADEQKEIIGYVDESVQPPAVVQGKITETTAAKLGAVPTSDTAAVGEETIEEGARSWSATNLAPGLYMALITGAAPDAEDGEIMHVYNPVFLAVQADNEGSELPLPLSYETNGTAKKSDITVDKKAKNNAGEWVDATSENVGDIIDFKVETTVPAYLESWTSPVFKVTDTMTSGLTLAVKSGEGDAALTDVTVTGATTGEMTAGMQYTINKTTDGYTITFSDSYLKNRTAAEKVTITYQAKITSDAATVNPETNTIKIEYSKNPTNTSDHGTKEDKTTHYTFSIDADLFGDSQYESSEIVKVGVDAAGNPVTEQITYHNGTKHNPLEGAEFKLYKADGTTPYTNAGIAADTVIVSNADGKLMVKGAQKTGIHGLEEGTYVLKETKAPTGYMLMTEPVTFVIEATYKDVEATATCNAYKELASYKVTVNNQEISSYSMGNGTIVKDAEGHAGDNTHEIKNTQGNSLPSTGGMGTTILYIIGGIMVLVAVVFLVTKKRVANKKNEHEMI